MSSPANWNALPSHSEVAASLPSLPKFVEGEGGGRIDLDGPMWRCQRKIGGVTIPVYRLHRPAERGDEMRDGKGHEAVDERGRPSMFAPTLAHSMELYLSHRLTRYAPLTVRGALSSFLHFERYCFDTLRFRRGGDPLGPEDLTLALVETYRAHCEENLNTKGSYPYQVARFYFWCYRRGYPGFSRKVALKLKAMRFEGALKGHIARMQCPRRGALEFEERAQIDEAIRDGVGDPVERTMVDLFRQTGIRPEAAALLRRRHLEEPSRPGEAWWLNIPRVKKRGDGGKETLWRRKVSAELGEALRALPVLAGSDPPLLPLESRGPKGLMRYRMKRWANDADLVTDRLPLKKGGKRYLRNPGQHPDKARLPLTPYRFRRTIAVMLANQGADAGTVAAALDDKTLGMASVYAQSSSTMAEILERTLDRHPEWIRVVRLFRGEVAEDGDENGWAVAGGIPQLADYPSYADIGVIGFCANQEDCTLYPPLSCYRCPFFRAVPRDLPHRRQLEQMKAEIRSGEGSESDRMASILERDAAAVVDLLARITKTKGPVGKAFDELVDKPIRRRS